MAASRQEENAELVRRGADGYNRGDIAAVLDLFDANVEVHTAPGLVNAGTYHGHDEFLQWLKQWVEAWEEFRIELEAVEPIGDEHVVAMVRQVVRGAGSGVEVEMRLAQLYEVRDGKATRFHLYPDRETALAAARHFRQHPDAVP
jgi:ketosteroid isomerase-like protein